VRTKVSPHVKYNKDTEEVETWVTYEEIIEPIKEVNMGKVKGMLEAPSEPKISYYPSYIPIERELLYAISNLIVALKNKDESIPDLPQCIEAVDEWLTQRYSDLEDHVLESGNGHLSCEKED
tara:strand:- start:242 stop:607 length:366 start_codon:yes stop_codon:yes gene_type:complete